MMYCWVKYVSLCEEASSMLQVLAKQVAVVVVVVVVVWCSRVGPANW